MVYIPFLISRVPPVHSFFQKKSILMNLTQNLVQLIFFNAYLVKINLQTQNSRTCKFTNLQKNL